MGLSLRGQSSGAIDINAPNAAGNNTITLPGSNGAANQFYKNSGTAGTLTHSSMIEDSSGRIGIGTDNPGEKFVVQGPVVCKGTLSAGQTSAGVLDFSGNDLRIRCYGATTGSGAFSIRTGGGAGDVDTEAIRITSDGEVQIANGNLKFSTAGTGIDFSANANAAGKTSELLDDYEEGDWTPRISFGNAETGITYTVQTGNYTKIGRQVTVTGYLTLSNKGTSTGELRIEGLPFTVRDSIGVYSYQNMFYKNILPSNIHTGKEIMSGGSQWFSSGYFGVDKAYQLNASEVYTHVRFRRVQTGAYSWCLLFVTSDGGSPATYTSQFAAVINVPAGGVLGEEIIMPFLNAPGDASAASGTNQGGVQMLYGAPATSGTATYIGWLSGDGNVGNNGAPSGAIYSTSSPTGGNIDFIQVNTTPTVGQTYGPVASVDTGTDIHISVFRDKTGGWCGPQTGNIGGFVVPNTTQVNVRTIRNSIIGHENLTDVAVVNSTQLGAFSWTYFTDA